VSKKCPILPNYHVRKDGTCKRWVTCYIQGRTKDPRCPAKGPA